MSLPLFPIALFSGDKVSIADHTADNLTNGSSSTASYSLKASGDIFAQEGFNGVSHDIGDWVAPKSIALNYECFATLNSGVLTSGTTGAWLALTADQGWATHVSGVGSSSTAVITVQIRRVGGSQILASAVITIIAETL